MLGLRCPKQVWPIDDITNLADVMLFSLIIAFRVVISLILGLLQEMFISQLPSSILTYLTNVFYTMMSLLPLYNRFEVCILCQQKKKPWSVIKKQVLEQKERQV